MNGNTEDTPAASSAPESPVLLPWIVVSAGLKRYEPFTEHAAEMDRLGVPIVQAAYLEILKVLGVIRGDLPGPIPPGTVREEFRHLLFWAPNLEEATFFIEYCPFMVCDAVPQNSLHPFRAPHPYIPSPFNESRPHPPTWARFVRELMAEVRTRGVRWKWLTERMDREELNSYEEHFLLTYFFWIVLRRHASTLALEEMAVDPAEIFAAIVSSSKAVLAERDALEALKRAKANLRAVEKTMPIPVAALREHGIDPQDYLRQVLDHLKDNAWLGEEAMKDFNYVPPEDWSPPEEPGTTEDEDEEEDR